MLPTWCEAVIAIAGSALFRQRHREDRIDSPAAEVFRIGEEVPVGIHHLGDGGMTEAGLSHLGIQVCGELMTGNDLHATRSHR
jgi:hypothetical protein